MLTMKFIEIRDRATCIPALAIRMRSDDPIANHFLWRSGYPRGDSTVTTIVLMRLDDQKATADPYDWDGRTMRYAHADIQANFDELRTGQVVDVRVVLGEATEPARAEIIR